ncbi:BAG family molecular chaperone regulator 2 isoform X2 [Lutzomyia longipalpis]|uniref:BAG family molecular chaperone regulator 2 isoform X2 n=1 Tax=Lutzomyia longipalpis TaxID=7200 RepID=UPI0024845B00|nr:BAG family molecular chaperone regulator 2 isoform X2 [Lutzomyia longipalpis]
MDNWGSRKRFKADLPEIIISDSHERFIKLVDELDNHVEKLRKDAITLQEKRDYLSMSMDLLKNNDLLSNLQEYEREEINCYMQRVHSRLATVELNVKTVRNSAQEECLHQVNVFIDSLISSPDAVISRQRCQMFLNACDGAPEAASGSTRDPCELTVDKKFESSLLGCTLDDQKTIKKRLHALITYLNKQTISD